MSHAEDLHSVAEVGFSFHWTIKNLSMSALKESDAFDSPDFNVPDLDNTIWCLKLYPRGLVDQESVMCFLYRKDDGGPESIRIGYSISLESSYFTEVQSFKKNTHSTTFGITNRHEYLRKVDMQLAEDTCSIECKLWQRCEIRKLQIASAVSCSVCTVIPIKKMHFFWPIENFNAVAGHNVVTAATGFPKLLCSLSHFGNLFIMTIHNKEEVSFPFVLKYSFQLVDSLKKYHHLVNGRYFFKKNHEFWYVSLSISRKLIEEKYFYLTNDTLLLYCELDVSSSTDVSYLESQCYYSSSIHLNQNCSWKVYLDYKYNENKFLFRLLAVLIVILSLIPHIFLNSEL